MIMIIKCYRSNRIIYLQETRDEIIFTNQLLYAFHDPTYHFIIRNYNWTLDLNCQISRDQYGHSQVTYNQSIDSSQTLNFTNQYKIDTQFFLDPNFKQVKLNICQIDF
jgi:hypothetical protein